MIALSMRSRSNGETISGRRKARDTKGAEAALDRLVQLVRPAGALGILARSSIEAAAEAAAAAWRAKPDDATALQTALATLLRRAINYELAARPHEECRTAWRAAVLRFPSSNRCSQITAVAPATIAPPS